MIGFIRNFPGQVLDGHPVAIALYAGLTLIIIGVAGLTFRSQA